MSGILRVKQPFPAGVLPLLWIELSWAWFGPPEMRSPEFGPLVALPWMSYVTTHALSSVVPGGYVCVSNSAVRPWTAPSPQWPELYPGGFEYVPQRGFAATTPS